MIRYIGWSCEFKKNSGEGQLARKFVNLNFNRKNIKIIIPKYNFIFSKYIYQIYGIFVLWYYYLLGKKIIYLNYLPLWNFIIFLMCPPNTIFGPITGSVQINKINNFKSLVRFYIFPILYKLSLLILNLRLKKLIFATNILTKYINKNISKKSEYNFILKNFKMTNTLKKNKNLIDLIVYFRKHENKFFKHHNILIKDQINVGKKVVIVGDKIKLKGAVQLGKVSKSKLFSLIKKSRYALSGDDNLLSFFNLECLQNNVKIIYNYKLKYQNIKKISKLTRPYNYELKKFIKSY
tara:strand:+ start:1185 stop:2063 length:879 start_codon:yes stop_codon:yes gene_type:complete